MSKHSTPPQKILTIEEVVAFLAANGLQIAQAPAPDPIPVDTTLNLPVQSARPDLSRIPPVGERCSAPIQLPPKVWGNPRMLTGR